MLEIPIEELPSESVTPALDSPVAVQNRSLSFTKRWQADFGAGWILDEPFYQNQFFGFRVTYNWNEVSGIGFRYRSFARGISDYGNQFQTQTNAAPNFGYSRGPELGYGLSYENRFIYGKVSFGKNAILPLSFLSQFDLEMIQYGTKLLPCLSAGVGNNLFFNDHFGVSLMVRFMMRQAVDPLSQTIVNFPNPAPTEGQFTSTTRFSTGLDFGAIYLF
jgi:outer membrane beta-barrel protein